MKAKNKHRYDYQLNVLAEVGSIPASNFGEGAEVGDSTMAGFWLKSLTISAVVLISSSSFVFAADQLGADSAIAVEFQPRLIHFSVSLGSTKSGAEDCSQTTFRGLSGLS
ncbi:hypothetical protein [Sinorhizobium sp. RAC02]|uniref:hypothetical protein n=1 Tax=Sinorhizobium sp. RAC02 TaxID=1842534 RepID=UPI0012379C1D|nr:hypothetical protein [Sinorhizobium sp. RAC02]